MQSTLNPTPWKDQLTTGDVVRFRFPVDDPDNPQAEAKRRPCLVLGLRWFDGLKFVEIAYGTGARSGANRGFEIRVKGGRAKAQAGLTCGTRFIGTGTPLLLDASIGYVAGQCLNTGLPACCRGYIWRWRPRRRATRSG